MERKNRKSLTTQLLDNIAEDIEKGVRKEKICVKHDVSISTFKRIADVMEMAKKKDYEGMSRVCKSGRILKWGIAKYCVSKEEPKKAETEKPKEVETEEDEIKVGDWVRVREDLEVDEIYDGAYRFYPPMKQYKGKVTRIQSVYKHGDMELLRLEYCWGWRFSPSMVEKAEEPKEEYKAENELFEEEPKIGETVEEQQVELSYRIGNVSFSAKGSEKWVEKAEKSFREIVEIAKQKQKGENGNE